jgi:methyl-accepting chemotaxis protein
MKLNLKNKKISLKILLPLSLSILFVLTGITFTVYFHSKSSKILVNEYEKRCWSLAQNLAVISRYDAVKGDKNALKRIIKGVLNGVDAVFVSITDTSGKELVYEVKEDERGLEIPEEIKSKGEKVGAAIPFRYKKRDYIVASNYISIDKVFLNKHKLDAYEEKEGNIGSIHVVLKLEHAQKKIGKITNFSIFFVIITIFIGFLISMILIKIILKPIDDITYVSNKIAKGDITKKVKDVSVIELSKLAASINSISENLTGVLGNIFSTTRETVDATGSVEDTTESLLEKTKDQFSLINKAFTSISELNTDIKLVVKELEELSTSADSALDSTEKMAGSIETISANSAKLSESIDNSSSSIVEMTSSIKDIAKNTNDLSNFMVNAKNSIAELDKTIHKVTKISKDAYSLSEKVKTNASDSGLRSVEQMSASMDKIKESVKHSTYTIKKLGSTSGQIGEILTVIESVTEQTDLLALNAAILAAQAGKHGKGFAVVADEIKALADRNASSTKEIAEIIKDIHQDVDNSVRAVSVGRDNVEEGVKQTEMVVRAFESIYQSANTSLEKANEIKEYSMSQAEQVESIKESIDMMSSMVLQVVSATNEQKGASEYIMKMTEEISGIINNIKESTKEQSSQNKRLLNSMSDIACNIKDVSKSIYEKASGTESIVEETGRLKETASSNIEYNSKLRNVLKVFFKSLQLLKAELNHFKIKK